jgi:ankyrin repeat protein
VIEDPDIPLRHYNYIYIRDLLKEKHNQKVSLFNIQHKGDVNARNKHGRTALMGAAREGRLIIAALLIDHSADVSVKKKFGKTAWKVAKENKLHETANFLRSPNAKAVLSGTGQIRINEPFLGSLLDAERVENLLD